MWFLPFCNESNVFDTVPYDIVFESERDTEDSVKIWCIAVFHIPDDPFISHNTIIHLSLSNNVGTIAVEALPIAVDGQTVRASCSVNLFPSRNRLNHPATVLRFTPSWLHTSHKLAVIIGGVLPLKHLILIYIRSFLFFRNTTWISSLIFATVSQFYIMIFGKNLHLWSVDIMHHFGASVLCLSFGATLVIFCKISKQWNFPFIKNYKRNFTLIKFQIT